MLAGVARGVRKIGKKLPVRARLLRTRDGAILDLMGSL
jgi:hypothetical protein